MNHHHSNNFSHFHIKYNSVPLKSTQKPAIMSITYNNGRIFQATLHIYTAVTFHKQYDNCIMKISQLVRKLTWGHFPKAEGRILRTKNEGHCVCPLRNSFCSLNKVPSKYLLSDAYTSHFLNTSIHYPLQGVSNPC
jgi:hypothetical protein